MLDLSGAMIVFTYVFLAVVGLVVGGLIVWLFMAAHPFETPEEPWRPPDPVEAAFLADEMTRRGTPLDEEAVTNLLQLHFDYLDGRARDNQTEYDRERLAAARERIRKAREAGDEEAAREAAEAEARVESR